jgi:hypothetical protein
MPSCKQAHYIQTEGKFDFVILPRGDLELTHDLVGLPKKEAAFWRERYKGDMGKFLHDLMFDRQFHEFLIGTLPRKGDEPDESFDSPFRRVSLQGRYGYSQNGLAGVKQGQIQTGGSLYFDGQLLWGNIVEVHTFPKEKPSSRSGPILMPSPYSPPRGTTGEIARTLPCEWEEATIDKDGRVKLVANVPHRWAPKARMDWSRMTFLNSFRPVGTALIKIGEESDRFVAFKYANGFTILCCPIKRHASLYCKGQFEFAELAGQTKEQLKRMGFRPFQHVKAWKMRLEQLIKVGKIISTHYNHPELPAVVQVGVTRAGRVKVKGFGIFNWHRGPRGLEPQRLALLRSLGPRRVYLVHCLDPDERYVAFIFERVVILTCPVRSHSTYWINRGAVRVSEMPVRLTTKEDAVKHGVRHLPHIGHWETRLKEIVEQGEPRTYIERTRRERKGTNSKGLVTA